jgi:hypothetical protein
VLSLQSANLRQGDNPQIESYVHSIGNLVLLSKGKNSVASRRDFHEKKVTYLVPRVSDFPRSVQVLQYESWTPEVIALRTKEASEKILDRI